MTRDKCTICIGRGLKEPEDAFHEIKWDRHYIHLCNEHYWMLHYYFSFWLRER